MVEAGRRLASDLRRIRELRGVSIESIIERTKASPDVLAAFEENALVDHPMYNRVYLRSFVRTYAEALDVDPEAALQAAEELLEGRYHGSLEEKYLSESEPQDSGGPVAEKPPEPALPEEPEEKLQPGPVAEPDADAEAPMEPDGGREEDQDSGVEPESSPRDEEKPEPLKEAESESKDALESGKREAAVSHPKSRDQAPTGPAPLALGPPWMGRLLWAVPVVVVLALAAVLLFGRSEVPEPSSVAPTEPTPVEPLPPARVDTTDTMHVALPPRVVLGDTVDVWVVAERDTLNPVRIKADSDMRRPFWVEIGDSTLVRITDRVVLERETDVLALSVSGYRLDLDRFAPGSPIELDREQIQAMLDSLRMVQ